MAFKLYRPQNLYNLQIRGNDSHSRFYIPPRTDFLFGLVIFPQSDPSLAERDGRKVSGLASTFLIKSLKSRMRSRIDPVPAAAQNRVRFFQLNKPSGSRAIIIMFICLAETFIASKPFVSTEPSARGSTPAVRVLVSRTDPPYITPRAEL